jgi:hypothetical protein
MAKHANRRLAVSGTGGSTPEPVGAPWNPAVEPAVATVTVMFAGTPDCTVTVLGVTVQLDCEGEPEHVKDRLPANPADPLTFRL